MYIVFVCLLVVSVLAKPLVHTQQTQDGHYIVYPDASDDTAQCTEDSRLCIGSWFAAKNEPHLKELRVTHIVTAIGEPGLGRIPSIKYLVLDLGDHRFQDMEAAFCASNQFIREALEGDPNAVVFVHCAAGVSRSSSIIINHWMESQSMTYDQALEKLVAIRSVVQPNVGFETQLRAKQVRMAADPDSERKMCERRVKQEL